MAGILYVWFDGEALLCWHFGHRAVPNLPHEFLIKLQLHMIMFWQLASRPSRLK